MLTKKWDDLGWWSWGGLDGSGRRSGMGGLAVRWHSILFVFSCIQTKPWVHITVSEEKICVSQSKLWFDDISCFTSGTHFWSLQYTFFFFKAFRVCFVKLQWLLCLVLCTSALLGVKAQFFQIPFLTLLLPKLTTWPLGWSEMVGVVGSLQIAIQVPEFFLGPCWAQLHGDHCSWWQC